MRRWEAGWTRMVDGIRFRVVAGQKVPKGGPYAGVEGHDLVMQWQIPGGQWRSISMAAAGLMADCWYENEEVLYPREAGFKGGEKYAQYLGVAMRDGWDVADAVLQSEKAASKASAVPFTIVMDEDPFADLEF